MFSKGALSMSESDTSGLLQDLCLTILDCFHEKKKQKFTTSLTPPETVMVIFMY